MSFGRDRRICLQGYCVSKDGRRPKRRLARGEALAQSQRSLRVGATTSRSSDRGCGEQKVADETVDGAIGPSKEVSQAVRRRSSVGKLSMATRETPFGTVVPSCWGDLSGRLSATRSESDERRSQQTSPSLARRRHLLRRRTQGAAASRARSSARLSCASKADVRPERRLARGAALARSRRLRPARCGDERRSSRSRSRRRQSARCNVGGTAHAADNDTIGARRRGRRRRDQGTTCSRLGALAVVVSARSELARR